MNPLLILTLLKTHTTPKRIQTLHKVTSVRVRLKYILNYIQELQTLYNLLSLAFTKHKFKICNKLHFVLQSQLQKEYLSEGHNKCTTIYCIKFDVVFHNYKHVKLEPLIYYRKVCSPFNESRMSKYITHGGLLGCLHHLSSLTLRIQQNLLH
jgi:hypothetical protein